MKRGLSFRTKLSIGAIIISILISIGFGFSMYTISTKLFYKDFIQNKLMLAKSIAASIDGDKHHSFTSISAFNDPEFWRYTKYFQKVFKSEKYITWLISYNYDFEKDKIYYCIDGDEIENDTIWVESDKFSFGFYINKENRKEIIYNDQTYNDQVLIIDGENNYIISIIENSVYLNNVELFKVIFNQPLIILASNIEISEKIIGNNIKINYKLPNNENIDIFYSFSKKGYPSSNPGEEYIDTEEMIKIAKNIVIQNKDHIDTKAQESSYGKYLSIYTPIRNNENRPIGFVELDISTKQIELFKKDISNVAIIVSIITLIIILLISLFLSQNIITPLNKLLSTISHVSKGNYEIEINLRRNDEFGILAYHFNKMVANIKLARDELVKLNQAYYRFVPKDFLKFLGKNSILEIKLGDQVLKKMTILFSDIRSFTALSEAMTPQENFNFINSYLSRMGPIIRANEGFIDKYIGDAIMALFPDNVESAIKASIEMLNELKLYNKQRESSGYKAINIGIGIHTGFLMLGTIGESERMDSTVISDTVNLASRLEGLNKKYNTSIIISETTLKEVKNIENYNYRFIGKVLVAGKSECINIYEIYDYEDDEIKKIKNESKKDYLIALNKYFEKDINGALNIFKSLVDSNPNDNLYIKYFNKCNSLISKSNIENSDLIEIFDSK